MPSDTIRADVMMDAMSACQSMMHTDRRPGHFRAGYSAPNAVMATAEWMRITHGVTMTSEESAALLDIAEDPRNGWQD
jgi:hypothetical protein